MAGAPARGYSWPPFEPGNTVALRHGARSSRTLQPVAERLTAELVEHAPHLADPLFQPEVRAWAWAEARCALLRAWADEQAMVDSEGATLPALSELHRAENQARASRDRLGLSPRALARVMAELSQVDAPKAKDALEAMKEAGRRALARGQEEGEADGAA